MIEGIDPAIASAHVQIHRVRTGAAWAPRPSVSCFVHLRTEGGRRLGHRVIEGIETFLQGAIPDLKPEAITVADQTGHKYLAAGNPALKEENQKHAQEEDWRDAIAEGLQHIPGVGVSVLLETGRRPAAAARAPAGRSPPRRSAPTARSRLDPEPAPAPPAPPPADPGPGPTSGSGSPGASTSWRSRPSRPAAARRPRTSSRCRRRPRSWSATPSRSTIPRDDPRRGEDRQRPGRPGRTPGRSCSRRPRSRSAPGPGWPSPAPSACRPPWPRSRRWSGWRPAGRSARPSRSAWRPGFVADGPAGPVPGPSERVRELIRLNPEAAAGVLQRWIGQGGALE